MTTAILVASTSNESKPSRRPRDHATTRPAVRKVKVTLVLEEESARRLAVHSAMTGQDRSFIAEELFKRHLKRFRVQDFDKPETVPPTEEVSAG